MRGSRGPRQPGGGKQSAGPRHRHGSRHPEVRAKRATKSAAADLAPRSSKSGKPDFGRGHGPGPSPARSARFPPPQAGEGGERSSPGEGRQGRASFKQVPRPPQDDRKQQRFSNRLSPSQWRARRAEENQPPCRMSPSPATKPACASTAFSKPAFRA